jgi:hypothetical protein
VSDGCVTVRSRDCAFIPSIALPGSVRSGLPEGREGGVPLRRKSVLVEPLTTSHCTLQVKGLSSVVCVLPIHFASIVARSRGYGRVYIWLHGAWHLGSALAIINLLVPP